MDAQAGNVDTNDQTALEWLVYGIVTMSIAFIATNYLFAGTAKPIPPISTTETTSTGDASIETSFIDIISAETSESESTDEPGLLEVVTSIAEATFPEQVTEAPVISFEYTPDTVTSFEHIEKTVTVFTGKDTPTKCVPFFAFTAQNTSRDFIHYPRYPGGPVRSHLPPVFFINDEPVDVENVIMGGLYFVAFVMIIIGLIQLLYDYLFWNPTGRRIQRPIMGPNDQLQRENDAQRREIAYLREELAHANGRSTLIQHGNDVSPVVSERSAIGTSGNNTPGTLVTPLSAHEHSQNASTATPIGDESNLPSASTVQIPASAAVRASPVVSPGTPSSSRSSRAVPASPATNI